MNPSIMTTRVESSHHVETILAAELKKLLAAGVPLFGTLTMTVHFIDGDVSRIELGQSVARKIAPRSERGLQ